MLKTGHHLSNDEIRTHYEVLGHRGGLGLEFIHKVLSLAGDLKGLRVLDVGCGGGALLNEIATHQNDCELYGVDFSISRLGKASRLLDVDTVFLEADVQETIPFPEGFFDRIFCTETLEHLKYPDRCLYEIIRLLKPEGRLILTLPNATGFAPFHLLAPLIPGRWLKGRLLPYEHPSNTDQPIDTCYVYREILGLIQAAGFRIENVEGYRYFRYLQMLPLVRDLYRAIYPAVQWTMPKIGGVRFAYNLLFRCYYR